MDEKQKLKYEKSKYILKKWESEFKKSSDQLPTKADIKSAPKKIKDAYKTYWTLKRYGSAQQAACDIHEDENAKDCFNSSSEADAPLKDETNKAPNILEDSVCFQAVSEALTESKFGSSRLSEDATLSHQTPCKSESFNEETFTGSVFNNRSNELTPTSFKNLFNKENRLSSSEPLLAEDNKPSPLDEINARKRLEARSLSCQYAEKLFAGSKFNKRNPRKSRSFQNPKKASAPALNCSSAASDCANKIKPPSDIKFSFSQEISDFSISPQCSQLSNGTEEELPVLKFSDKFKIITENSALPTKTVNLLQQSFESSNISKPSISRNIDKGWLERINESCAINDKKLESNLAESQDSGVCSIKADSILDSSSYAVDSQSKSLINYCSDDDDVIYDSDCETQSSQLGKLNLLETVNRSANLSLNLSVRDTGLKPISRNISPVSSSTCADTPVTDETKTTESNIAVAQAKNDMRTIANKRYLFEDDIEDVPLTKRLKSDNQTTYRSTTKPEIIVPYQTFKKKSKIEDGSSNRKQELLEKKLASGDANKNFVKINIEKKKYARGKKKMTFSKYKKQKWKDMKKGFSNEGTSGVLKCFRCGDVGHFSKACHKQNDTLVPLEDYDSTDDSPFPTLEEAAEMAKEAAEKVHKYGRKFTKSEETKSLDIPEIDEPPCFSSNIQPLFNLSPDGSVIDTPKEVYAALKELGHDDFRLGQEKGIMRILSGLSTIVTLSTGSGKSLIYQLPAYMYNKVNPGCITLVISPLVSLMEDQIFCGSKKLHAACLHHNMTQKKRETVLEMLKNRSVSVLLIAPESLSSWDSAKSLLKLLPPIAFACIDEAHSISQHSHNFRPSYLTICQVLREKMGISTLLGLTATASASTLQTIMSELGIDDASSIISDIPLPDNLNLSVSSEYDRREALISLLNSERFSECDSIIIYCTRREECDKIAAFLRTSLQETTGDNKKGRLSVHAEAYHAGLTAGRRNQVQSAFMSGKLRIVVATVAFGMGINKSDIRGIIHYNMPYSFESYVQEVGRAGRDKKPAHCHLFLDSKRNDLDELKRHIYADTMDRHTIRKLLQLVFVPCNCTKKIPHEKVGEENDGCSEAGRTAACSKHEVAFPIESTVTSLDLPQEVISTLLAYLQLDKEKWIKVLPLAYTKCKIQSYKGARHLKKVARDCPPLAVIMAEDSSSFEKAFIEFDIVKLAREINWDSGTIKHYLKQLEWTTVDGKPKKSGIMVEFSCLGFRVLSPGNLTDAQLDLALDLLHSKVKKQEESRIKQLSLFYDLLLKVAHDDVSECCDGIDQDKCDELKTEIRKFFSSTDPLAGIDIKEEEIEDVIEVASDIRRLIATYRSDNNFSGRNIARILHGIGSPNFPPIVWGRTKFWRLHLDKDFNSLVVLANKQLILMR